MKLKTLMTLALLAALGVVAPRVAISQPSPTGDYEPGYWQPEATIANVNAPVNVTLINDTGITLHYGYYWLRGMDNFSTGPDVVFPNGDRDQFPLYISSTNGDIASINIYDPNQTVPGETALQYRYNTSGNNLLVRVSLASDITEAAASGAVYIDERGRVYTFD